MAVDLNSFVWASAGVEPTDAEDAIYTAGDQPIAGYDNFIMWAVTEDIHNLDAYAESHALDHEAGGPQEINLDGLSVGAVADILDNNGNFQLHDGTTAFVDIDVDADTIHTFPAFSTSVDATSGLATGANITRVDGDVIYNHADDRFHRAEHALDADHALAADDADALGGDLPSAYIQPDDSTRTITGTWTFDNLISGSIDGNAATADYATDADSANTADLASDSNALEGEPRSTFTENAASEDVTGAWAFLSGLDHVNSGDFEGFAAVNNNNELVFRNGDSRFEYVPYPGGAIDAADWFGYDFQNNRWNFGDNLFINGSEVALSSEVEAVKSDQFDTSANYTITGDWIFDFLIDGTITEAQHATDADNALEADWALDADNALYADDAQNAEYANDSDRVDGYHAQEVIDEAKADLANDFVDVADNGTTITTNTDQITFDANLDVTNPSAGVAAVGVDSVGWADEAEYAYDADKVDGYHAQDIIDEANSGEGLWTVIGTWEKSAGAYWDLDINLSSTEVYDRYKIITMVEDVTSSGHYAIVWARLNGDSRDRYNFMKYYYRNGSWHFDEQDRQRFWVPPADPGYMNTGEMIINCPPEIDGRANNYPTFGDVTSGGHAYQDGGYVKHGRLETSYSNVDQFTFWPNKEIAFRVKILGQDI